MAEFLRPVDFNLLVEVSCQWSRVLSTTFGEPHEGMEFDSHEAAYAFYRDYARTVGFGTAKLNSRRSRASKEFIDAKFSCIWYGNKQQSNDANNPRPSPKIGCKAGMHVKRRPGGKWKCQKRDTYTYITCFLCSYITWQYFPGPRLLSSTI